MKTKKAFIKEAVKNIKTSGTIMPSSRFLSNKLIQGIDFDKAKVIVEFGPGNGVVTKKILEKMATDATLISFEINDEFYKHLITIEDERLIVINASAENVIKELNRLNINEVDGIVSSLPLTIIPKEVVNSILVNSRKILKINGQFSQFQYSTVFYKKIKEIFKPENVKLKFEVKNFPPAFIYKCIKK